jgi:hypothetical protein
MHLLFDYRRWAEAVRYHNIRLFSGSAYALLRSVSAAFSYSKRAGKQYRGTMCLNELIISLALVALMLATLETTISPTGQAVTYWVPLS